MQNWGKLKVVLQEGYAFLWLNSTISKQECANVSICWKFERVNKKPLATVNVPCEQSCYPRRRGGGLPYKSDRGDRRPFRG